MSLMTLTNLLNRDLLRSNDRNHRDSPRTVMDDSGGRKERFMCVLTFLNETFSCFKHIYNGIIMYP